MPLSVHPRRATVHVSRLFVDNRQFSWVGFITRIKPVLQTDIVITETRNDECADLCALEACHFDW